MKAAEAKRSGEHRTILALPSRTSASARAAAPSSMPEAIMAAGWPPRIRRRYWSAISAISGETTTVRASEAMPGSW
jgi:hypothetical protein